MGSIKRWDEILKSVKNIKVPMVAEIGVDNGKTSKQLLAQHQGLILYMVDWWQKPPADNTYAHSGASIAIQDNNYFSRTEQNCRAIANQYKKRAFILKGDSVKQAELIDAGKLDLVFIDADHSYEGCKRDILAWKSKVKKGGYVSGHDYAHPDQGEVKKAVDEIFGSDKIILGENRTWFYKVV
jgi:hypothetical protein